MVVMRLDDAEEVEKTWPSLGKGVPERNVVHRGGRGGGRAVVHASQIVKFPLREGSAMMKQDAVGAQDCV